MQEQEIFDHIEAGRHLKTTANWRNCNCKDQPVVGLSFFPTF